jgi:leucyl-tRNA synthetase
MRLFGISGNAIKGRDGQSLAKDRQMQSRLHSTIRKITSHMESFQFNKAISSLMSLANSLNKYMENPHKDIFSESLKSLLIMLSPFAPHTCEELWERMGWNKSGKDFISIQKWPHPDEKLIDPKMDLLEEMVERTRDDIRNVIRLVGKQPKEIIIYVSPFWKYEVHKTILIMEEGRDYIKEIMKHPETRKQGKHAVNFAEKLKKEKVLGHVLSQEEELQALSEAAEGFKKTFSAKITVMKAEQNRNERSLKAEPGKPGIELITD